jgi:8-oxo-dGTP diphosphatase
VTATQPPPRHSVSVAAAIIDDHGRFLAIRRADNGRWEPPGGVLELDESIEAGLIREVAEETGLTVEPIALTGVYKNMQRGIVALVFRCEITSRDGEPPPGEVAEIAWLAPEQLSRMSQAYRVRLLDALDSGSPHVRAHDGAQLLEQHR